MAPCSSDGQIGTDGRKAAPGPRTCRYSSGAGGSLVASPRLRRTVALLATTLLAMLLITPASVSAAPPGWKFLAPTKVPAVVGPNLNAGYSFTIKNQGKSNIAAVYLTTDI